MNNLVETVEGIAVIGMGVRYPGAQNIDQFWQNLKDGVESIQSFSDADMEAAGVSHDLYKDPNYIKAGTVLADVDAFDAGFFGFNPREAEVVDPQQRIFLETAWQALETAGYDAETYQGLIGVYAGASLNNYVFDLISGKLDISTGEGYQKMLGNEKDYLSSRVSYKLNLRGPSFTVQTACSTSLVAVHLACQDLLNYQCDMALAGGVCVILPQKRGYLYQEGMIFSPDGHCRAFDAKAMGTVPGQGAGIVVLKRLSDALADGDHIDAVIKGSAINNDGALKVGFTAPSVDGQADVIAAAQAISQIDPATITYIEAHGTATQLGDPIEIAALTQAFQAATQKTGFCAIGSVKTNIGHLDVAAGVTGLIKTVLALKHKQLPPSLHFKTPNPEIDFDGSPFYVNTRLADWKVKGMPRRAGVSSFGIGGTNAHVVLEEAPPAQPTDASRPQQLLLLSAKTESAVDRMRQNLADHLKQHPDIDLADVGYTLKKGRRAFNHRRALVCDHRDAAMAALESPDTGSLMRAVAAGGNREVVFMFSGQGAQYVNMGLELYQTENIFRDVIDRCAQILSSHIKQDLRDILYPENTAAIDASQQNLIQTAITQPALFTVEYALAKLWESWGIKPVSMVGHSIGEYVAACLAGVFSLEDALALVAARGRLIQHLPGGAMLVVSMSEQEVQAYVGNPLALAAINAPGSCVLSGKIEAIEDVELKLSQQDFAYQRLHTSHAFHSKMMDPILKEFEAHIRRIELKPPQIPYLTNVTGTQVTADQATDPGHWSKHLRLTVRFADCIKELINVPGRILLEVGPGNTLSTLARMGAVEKPDLPIFSSMRHPKKQTSDLAFILKTLGRLWLAGIQVDWDGLTGTQRYQRIPLPTYPFERQRYWRSESDQTDAVVSETITDKGASGTLPNSKNDISDWFYAPSWKRSIVPSAESDKPLGASSWLVFIDDDGFGDRLLKSLAGSDINVVTVKAGSSFTQLSDGSYSLNPEQDSDYVSLFDDLRSLNRLPDTIVHLWTVNQVEDLESKLARLDESQNLGMYSLLEIAKAYGKQNVSDGLRLVVISNNMHEVTGGELLYPEKSTILGPCKVIPLEFTNISCQNIDIIFPVPDSHQEEKLIQQLITEILSESSSLIVAFRHHHRWVPTFEPHRIDVTHEEPTRLRQGGVYFIAGGLGGIGIEMAEHLAKTVQAKLILTGLSEFPDRDKWENWIIQNNEDDEISRKIRKLQAIEALGSELQVAGIDIADLNRMQEFIDNAIARFGKINGVIHAAGVIDDAGGIARRTREMNEKVISSKVSGTLVIDHILKKIPLDFIVLFSSDSTELYHERFGQVGYVSANSFLDAYSYYKTTKDNTKAVTINWGDWREVGMTVRAEKQFVERFGIANRLLVPLNSFSPSEGISAFMRILNKGISRMIVSTRDLFIRVKQDVFSSSPFVEAASEVKLSQSSHSRPELSTDYTAPDGETEIAIAEIWQDLLGIEKIGVQDDYFELGGDSLRAIQVIARMSETFNVDIQLQTLFDSPTVKNMAEKIETLLWARQGPSYSIEQAETNVVEGEI